MAMQFFPIGHWRAPSAVIAQRRCGLDLLHLAATFVSLIRILLGKMQLSFCYKLRSRGWRTLQCWYWRWGNSCRASQLVVNRSSTTTSPVLFGTFFIISEIFGLSTEILWISAMPQGRTHICFDILHLFEAREEVRPFAPQYQPNILNFEGDGSIIYFWTDPAKKSFFESFVTQCICRWMSA